MTNLTYMTLLTSLTCGVCEIPFAMPDDLLRAAQNDGRFFWCPNGHKIHYTESEIDRLKNRLAREKRWREQAEARATHEGDQRRAAELSAAAYKGHATRLRKNAAAGVCPVPECHRHFENLARHMTVKHPGFADEGV